MAEAIIQVSEDGVRPANNGAGTAAVVVDSQRVYITRLDIGVIIC